MEGVCCLITLGDVLRVNASWNTNSALESPSRHRRLVACECVGHSQKHERTDKYDTHHQFIWHKWRPKANMSQSCALNPTSMFIAYHRGLQIVDTGKCKGLAHFLGCWTKRAVPVVLSVVRVLHCVCAPISVCLLRGCLTLSLCV